MLILTICVVGEDNYFELTDPGQVMSIESILHGGGAIIIFIHVSSLFSICFIQVSQLLSYKDHALFAPIFLLESHFISTYIYIFIYSFIHGVYLYTLLHSILLQRVGRVL